MSKEKKILAIIPARGGSKGVPKKNIIEVNGKPLIAYTIMEGEKAKQKGIIDELIVSTDDEEIAEISRQCGAKVPFIRPRSIATDKSKSVDLMIHAYNYYKDRGEHYDAILLLQPTSPLRSYDDIRESIRVYESTRAKSLISCYKEETIIEFGIYHKEDNYALALNNRHNCGDRRQDIPDLYVRNGAIFIVDSKYMIENHKVISDKPAMYVMPKKRSINIDTMDDICLVREYFKNFRNSARSRTTLFTLNANINENRKNYILGTGREALLLFTTLMQEDVYIDAFCMIDGDNNDLEIMNKPVLDINEIKNFDDANFFIGEKEFDRSLEILKEYGVENIWIDYRMFSLIEDCVWSFM